MDRVELPAVSMLFRLFYLLLVSPLLFCFVWGDVFELTLWLVLSFARYDVFAGDRFLEVKRNGKSFFRSLD